MLIDSPSLAQQPTRRDAKCGCTFGKKAQGFYNLRLFKPIALWHFSEQQLQTN
jgi:hypothetical protein